MKSLPNALLSSARRPPLRNSRSLYPNCCSTNAPTVADTVVLSRTVGIAPPVTVVAPPARFSASATLRSFLVLKYWAPTVVRDVRVGLSVNDAVPLTSSVYWKNVVRSSCLKPVLTVAKFTQSSRIQRSVSIRLA